MAYTHLLNFYPTYSILDDFTVRNGYNKLNIFMDLKNNLQGTYLEGPIQELVNESKARKFLSSGIFSSFLSFIAFHKKWSMLRDCEVNFYVFFESGDSYYHTNLLKTYKCRRKIDNLYNLNLDDRELFKKIMQANFSLIESAGSKLPNVNVIRLHHLEADFIPYYLISRNLVDNNACNVVYSCDHDMYQCTNISENVYVYSRFGKNKKIVKHGESIQQLIKRDCNLDPSVLPLLMAITGEDGDDVPGIKGVAYITAIKIANELGINDNIAMEQIYSKLINNKAILPDPDPKYTKATNHVLEQEKETRIISRNIKLVSFEYLSRVVDDPFDTNLLERRDKIRKVITEKTIANFDSLRTALFKVGVEFQDELDMLYGNIEPGGFRYS